LKTGTSKNADHQGGVRYGEKKIKGKLESKRNGRKKEKAITDVGRRANAQVSETIL